jgi:hypothetical protein
MIVGVTRKQNRAVAIYHEAYSIMKSFDPTGNWVAYYEKLKTEDLCGPYRDEELDKLLETRWTPLWIWTVPVTNKPCTRSNLQVNVGNSASANEHLLSEWARQCARVQCHKEEIQLLVEEMHCVLTFLDAKSSWWKEQGQRQLSANDPCVLNNVQILRGLTAYSIWQLCILSSLSSVIASDWLPLLRKAKLRNEWIGKFAHMENLAPLQGECPTLAIKSLLSDLMTESHDMALDTAFTHSQNDESGIGMYLFSY